MTPTEFVDFCKQRHNATNDPFWSPAEIYTLITAASCEVLSLLGIVEATNSTQSTVVGTSNYTVPTGCVTIRALLYGGEKLSPISMEEWETRKSDGTTPQGRSDAFVTWNDQVILVPTPSEVKVLTFYFEQTQTAITGTGDTIVVPSDLHYRLANRVIEWMYDKDKNQVSMGMARKYHDIWVNEDMPAFQQYKIRKRKQHRARRIKDADTYVINDFGIR